MISNILLKKISNKFDVRIVYVIDQGGQSFVQFD
jgi:hypothetical protein